MCHTKANELYALLDCLLNQLIYIRYYNRLLKPEIMASSPSTPNLLLVFILLKRKLLNAYMLVSSLRMFLLYSGVKVV